MRNMLSRDEVRDAQILEHYSDRYRAGDEVIRYQAQLQELMQRMQAAEAETKAKPSRQTAVGAFLTDEAIFIETDSGSRIKLTPNVVRTLTTLIEMAALAKLIPADPAP